MKCLLLCSLFFVSCFPDNPAPYPTTSGGREKLEGEGDLPFPHPEEVPYSNDEQLTDFPHPNDKPYSNNEPNWK